MNCTHCGHEETRVIDSRPVSSGLSMIRRRRQCCGCGERFTTYELPMQMRKCETYYVNARGMWIKHQRWFRYKVAPSDVEEIFGSTQEGMAETHFQAPRRQSMAGRVRLLRCCRTSHVERAHQSAFSFGLSRQSGELR